MGLREKAVGLENSKGESLSETGCCTKECAEGKVREGRKRMVNSLNNMKELSKEDAGKGAQVWPLI